MYRELDLKDIRANGWIAEFLKTQAQNATGEMDEIGMPFSGDFWGTEKNYGEEEGEKVFTGGISTNDLRWVPFEQTAYWIDGMVRAGRLIDDKRLLEKSGKRIYPVLENQGEDGFIGPDFLRGDITWQFAVYSRALIAEYTATNDPKILDALKKYYLGKPKTNIFTEYKGSRMLNVRNIADVEGALWLYGKIGDKRLLDWSEKMYADFNEFFKTDKGANKNSKMRDVTLKGMLSDRLPNENHGVTYCEMCKMAAILHLYTGKEIYKQAAVKAFDKVYKAHMIVDGVISTSEYLNGNEDSYAVHETCDVCDFTWAVGYLYMITGDEKYGDWIENAIFNGGIGSVDDDFTSNQYFSCPNQIIANDFSQHVYFYRGADWMSYSPKAFLACCAGNVHRFMPNYVIRSAFISDENQISFLTYAPATYTFNLDGKEVKIEEITNYPFEEKIKFKISCEGKVGLNLKFRIPEWAVKYTTDINGKKIAFEKEGGSLVCKGEFNCSDEINIEFASEIKFIENAKGVSVKKGALLYALPVKERVVVEGFKEKNNPKYPHYSLYCDSEVWNYALNEQSRVSAKFVQNENISLDAWKSTADKSYIEIMALELKDQNLTQVKSFKRRLEPRGKGKTIKEERTFTPIVSKKSVKDVSKRATIKLVPYCSTRLRIAIFPQVK